MGSVVALAPRYGIDLDVPASEQRINENITTRIVYNKG
jgi:hypothetical protein